MTGMFSFGLLLPLRTIGRRDQENVVMLQAGVKAQASISGHDVLLDTAKQVMNVNMNKLNWTKVEKDGMEVLMTSLDSSYNENLDTEQDDDEALWGVETAKYSHCFTTSSSKFATGGTAYQEKQTL